MLNKSVTPAKAGVQFLKTRDSGFRRNDEFGLVQRFPGWAAPWIAIEAHLAEFSWKEEYAANAIDCCAMGNAGHAAAQVRRFVDVLVERLPAKPPLV